MLFNSLAFAYFFAALLIVSLIAPRSWIKYILLGASLFFYSYWYPPYFFLLIFSVVIDYYCGLKIFQSSQEASRKFYLWASVVLNLGILFGYKYLAFATSIIGYDLPPELNLALPLGISFFTFQTMAYTIDVYRKDIEAKKSFLDFLLFICFFPQLIAGPILRVKESFDEVINPLKPSLASINSGLYLIFWGLLKKMIIADNLAGFVDTYFNDLSQIDNTITAWLAVYAFAAQIYCDFSGYVDCALGIGLMFNINLPDNFHAPYLSQSITEFWRRWHITLSSWLKDYLYIPLGGNKHGSLATYKNLLITMLLGGLWHGANWTFVVWGAIHGIWLSLERLIGLKAFSGKNLFTRAIAVLVTFHVVCFSWVYFRAADLATANQYILKLLSFKNFAISSFTTHREIILMIAAAFLLHLFSWSFKVKHQIKDWRLEFRLLFLIISIILILLFGVHQEQRFIYFDF